MVIHPCRAIGLRWMIVPTPTWPAVVRAQLTTLSIPAYTTTGRLDDLLLWQTTLFVPESCAADAVAQAHSPAADCVHLQRRWIAPVRRLPLSKLIPNGFALSRNPAIRHCSRVPEGGPAPDCPSPSWPTSRHAPDGHLPISALTRRLQLGRDAEQPNFLEVIPLLLTVWLIVQPKRSTAARAGIVIAIDSKHSLSFQYRLLQKYPSSRQNTNVLGSPGKSCECIRTTAGWSLPATTFGWPDCNHARYLIADPVPGVNGTGLNRSL
jgi:hypothetical protein